MAQSANPVHVGLIVDGIRRWAERQAVPLPEAYALAMQRALMVMEFFYQQDAQYLSVYLLSKQNLSRPPADLQAALSAEIEFLDQALPTFADKWQCAVRHAGTASLLPDAYAGALKALQAQNIGATRTLYLLAAYDPWDELAAASQHNGEPIIQRLWVPHPVDLLIRTSGEYRLSGFLPLQCSNAELCVLPKHVTELLPSDCERALAWYTTRERRFGR